MRTVLGSPCDVKSTGPGRCLYCQEQIERERERERGGDGGVAVVLAAACCVHKNTSPTASFGSLLGSFIADAHF
jgi:hypothetical protein